LSLSWPGTTCIFNRCNSIGKKDYFDLHGLWPDGSNGRKNLDWTEKDLSPQNQKEVPIYWNWLYSNEMKFINHELGKHGKYWNPNEADLSKAPKEIADVISNADFSTLHNKLNAYLQVAISWSKANDLYSVLKSKGIQPGDQRVPTLGLVSAFEEHFGVKNCFFPVCKPRKHRKHYISEVRFCLDVNYQMTACDPRNVKNHIRSCTRNVIYPVFPNIGIDTMDQKYWTQDY